MGRSISVRRSVLTAVAELEALAAAGTDINPLDLAEGKIGDFHAAGDREGAKFWREVWLHIMFQKYLPTEFSIIEDGEKVSDGRKKRRPINLDAT